MRKLLFTLLCLLSIAAPAFSSADEPAAVEPILKDLEFRLIQLADNNDETPVFSINASTHLIDPYQHTVAIKGATPIQIFRVQMAPGQAVPWKLNVRQDVRMFPFDHNARKANAAFLRKTLKWQDELRELLETEN